MLRVKPILKWVGGKRLQLPALLERFQRRTKNIETFHDIFVGGGSVLLAVLSRPSPPQVVCAYDSNETLIHLYQNVQRDFQAVFDETHRLATTLDNITNNLVNRNPCDEQDAIRSSRESFYYWIRKQYNAMSQAERNSVRGSALFLFLNKTCFRGLYRVGPNGFNVPYGNYKKVDIIEHDHLRAFSALIQNVSFRCMDFRDSIRQVKPGDFMYLDPPYAPVSETSFVQYTKDGFTKKDHECLFQTIKDSGVCFLMSNSDAPMVLEAFPAPEFETERIVCKRAIHSKKPDAVANEVMITQTQ